jgi:hypothetical protein
MKTYKRFCPGCGKEIFHSTASYCRSREKKGTLCKSCGCRNPDRLKRMSIINSGKNNPFFGKKHSQDTKKKIGSRDYSGNSTQERREQVSLQVAGSGNPMYGRSVYDVWVEKYGIDGAERRKEYRRKILSSRFSGSGNPMYGRPSPEGSGNGWSGWYKGWYFRSLRELSYVVGVLEKHGLRWVSAESGELGIPYEVDGVVRKYFADFLVNDSILVEVKPKKLMETRRNIAKKNAATLFCEQRGWSYHMVDVKMLDDSMFVSMYRGGVIKFIERYRKKMDQRIRGTSR